MMSAFLGGRSGNRGACAGPLLPALDASAGLRPGQPGKACHLSLKDMDYIPHIRELMDAGGQRKIEGPSAHARIRRCRGGRLPCRVEGQLYDEKLVRDIFLPVRLHLWLPDQP